MQFWIDVNNKILDLKYMWNKSKEYFANLFNRVLFAPSCCLLPFDHDTVPEKINVFPRNIYRGSVSNHSSYLSGFIRKCSIIWDTFNLDIKKLSPTHVIDLYPVKIKLTIICSKYLLSVDAADQACLILLCVEINLML